MKMGYITYGPPGVLFASMLGVFTPFGVPVLSIRPTLGVAGDVNSTLRFAEPFTPFIGREFEAFGVNSSSLYDISYYSHLKRAYLLHTSQTHQRLPPHAGLRSLRPSFHVVCQLFPGSHAQEPLEHLV